ncbi:histone H2B.1, sperm-like [Pantherophis guttatus]|uniref:Histone H2B.1, sperm-like n=1 Tax=Pantherophis guttatus TaxID=94885 RepID=A0ABM3ZMF8_PANGU|nr:histone H2B.1, sperm-like [Pantherophis guttatus]
MAAISKRKRRNQRSPTRKNPRKQIRGRKTQAKRGRKTKSRQVAKYVKKNSRKKNPYKHKELPLTKKARGILSSCVEGLCEAISSEADRLRKEKCEPQISHKVLLTALEKSLSKKNIRHSVTPEVKKIKRKRQPSVEVGKKGSNLSEQQAEPNQKLPKQRKQPSSPITE